MNRKTPTVIIRRIVLHLKGFDAVLPDWFSSGDYKTMLKNFPRGFRADERSIFHLIDSRATLAYNRRVIFEWDENKAKANLRKHKISFAEAETVFDDPLLVTFADEAHSVEEERLISIGLSKINRVLLIVHTENVDNGNEIIIRIISCRKATALEREVYEKQF